MKIVTPCQINRDLGLNCDFIQYHKIEESTQVEVLKSMPLKSWLILFKCMQIQELARSILSN